MDQMTTETGDTKTVDTTIDAGGEQFPVGDAEHMVLRTETLLKSMVSVQLPIMSQSM